MDERMTTEELAEHLVNVADYEMASAVARGYAGTILEGVRRRTDKYRAAARRLTLLAKVVEAVKKQGDNSPNTERALAALASDLPERSTR